MTSDNEKGRKRYMRLMVFFDLPVETSKQRREYRLFRKKLLKEGYLMIQKSVYSKLVINENAARIALGRLKKIRPPEGQVQVLRVTEKQYVNMACIVGEAVEHEEIDTSDEVIVL